MSLCPQPGSHVPEETARVARAAFPTGTPSWTLRAALATLYTESDFADVFPQRGPPAASPGRRALLVVVPCADNLSDRPAADAVRRRIDWQSLLGVDLVAPGYACSVLRACRARLLGGGRDQRLWDALLERCRAPPQPLGRCRRHEALCPAESGRHGPPMGAGAGAPSMG
jgi:transposase